MFVGICNGQHQSDTALHFQSRSPNLHLQLSNTSVQRLPARANQDECYNQVTLPQTDNGMHDPQDTPTSPRTLQSRSPRYNMTRSSPCVRLAAIIARFSCQSSSMASCPSYNAINHESSSSSSQISKHHRVVLTTPYLQEEYS